MHSGGIMQRKKEKERLCFDMILVKTSKMISFAISITGLTNPDSGKYDDIRRYNMEHLTQISCNESF